MVVVPMLPPAGFGRNDHRESTLQALCGGNFWCSSEFEEGSHVTHMHAVWILVHPIFLSKINRITSNYSKFDFDPTLIFRTGLISNCEQFEIM